MRRVAAVTALVTAAGLAGVPSAAWAVDEEAPRIRSVSAPDEPLVLRAKGTTRLVMRARVTDDVRIQEVVVGLDDVGSGLSSPVGFKMRRVSGTARDGVWKVRLTASREVPVGRWTVRIYARDAAGNQSAGAMKIRDTFSLKYRTRVVGFDGTPEAVAPGAAATFTGRLDRVSPMGWTQAASRTVTLQFRKKGTATWVTRKSVRVQGDGTFRVKTRVKAAGSWRAVFTGTAALAVSASGVDGIALAS